MLVWQLENMIYLLKKRLDYAAEMSISIEENAVKEAES